MQRVIHRTVLPALLTLGACGGSGGDGAGNPGSPGTTPDSGSATSSDGAAGPDDAGVRVDGSSTDGAVVVQDAGHGPAGDAAIEAAGPPDAAAGGTGPYGGSGPDTVTTSSLQVPAPNATFTTTAYIPSGPGPFPVVVLSSGFFQSGVAYAPYASRLASWGIVTLLRDDPNLGEATPSIVSDVQYTVGTWLATTNADTSSALHGAIDTSRVGLAGHSRGGQIALLAGEALAGKIHGVFGLDPVDTSMNGSAEARTTLATIGVPVAFIGETTDSAASSCAPATDNYQVLYQAAVSPAVAITSVNADHTMFEDPASCFACTACTPGTASQAQVMATAVRYLTAFFARQLLGDATVGAAFQGAGASQDVAAGRTQLVSK